MPQNCMHSIVPCADTNLAINSNTSVADYAGFTPTSAAIALVEFMAK